MHLSIHKEMVASQKPELPPASFEGLRDYFGYGRCQKNVCNPYAYAFLCYHLYIHEPIILHHAAPMVVY